MLIKTLVLAACTVVLSGCTIKLPFNAASPAAPAGEGVVDNSFGQKVQRESIWKSIDGGQTFEVKSRVDETQSIAKADILGLSFHPQDSQTIYAGTVDSGIFRTTDGGEYWTPIVFPPKKIYSFILDKSNPDLRMFASGTIGNLGKIFRTDDGGENWRSVYTEPSEKTVITILAQHPRDTNVLFAGTSAGTVVKSTDSGETWQNVGGALEGPITEIVFDASNPLSLYALSFDKKVYYSSDGGLKWLDWEVVKEQEMSQKSLSGILSQEERDQVEAKKMPSGLLSLTADPRVSGRVYVSKLGGLYRSNDFGKNWEKLNTIESAEAFPIRAVAISPTDSNEISFVAGPAFYKSKNLGNTWAVVDLFIDRGVSVLAYDPNNPLALYLALRKF